VETYAGAAQPVYSFLMLGNGMHCAQKLRLPGNGRHGHKLKLTMQVRFGKNGSNKPRITCAAMTLVEILIALIVLVVIMGGVITGYVQANRMAEFSSMSLAAQSTALQGIEQAIAARWNGQSVSTNTGPGTDDELGCVENWIPTGSTNVLDIPVSGAEIPVTNYVTITQISTSPKLRQIRSDAVWTFPFTGEIHTNTVITLRAPDQ
jgi:type II secretory pathway pseudopilin PulG